MKYKVIIADPPWRYANFKAAANGAPQYKTLSYKEIRDIPIQNWADNNCLLLLWTTWPLLQEGVSLVKEWGFSYITGWPWVKTLPNSADISTGVGFWAQSASEILLIARKGKISPPKVSKQLGLMFNDPKVFYAPASRKHSKKPEELQDWVEANFDGPYLELFATRKRGNWECWGLDLGYELTAEGVFLNENGCKVLKA